MSSSPIIFVLNPNEVIDSINVIIIFYFSLKFIFIFFIFLYKKIRHKSLIFLTFCLFCLCLKPNKTM